MSDLRMITVFLASSDELVDDRTGIGAFFTELNNILVPRGEYLKLIKWEWGSHAIAPTRKQEEYNELDALKLGILTQLKLDGLDDVEDALREIVR